MFQCTQCAWCPLGHPRIPSHKGGCSRIFFLPFDGLLFALYHFTRSHTPWCGLFLPPFAVSHDLTHLGRKVREHTPLKKNHMPWAHGPANITAFPIDFASRFPPGTLVTWILKNTSELISLRDSHRWPIWSVWLLCMVSPIDFASRFPPSIP